MRYRRQETTCLPISVKSGNTDIIFVIHFNSCFHCKYHLNHKKNTLGDAGGIRGFWRNSSMRTESVSQGHGQRGAWESAPLHAQGTCTILEKDGILVVGGEGASQGIFPNPFLLPFPPLSSPLSTPTTSPGLPTLWKQLIHPKEHQNEGASPNPIGNEEPQLQ